MRGGVNKMLLVLALLFAAVAHAQVPLPVTRWHSDATVRLPSGAFTLPRDTCAPLVLAIGQGERADAVCYYWLDDVGNRTYALLVLNLEAAGYVLTNEGPLPQDAPGTLSVFVNEQRAEVHVLFVMYPSDGSVMMVALPETLE